MLSVLRTAVSIAVNLVAVAILLTSHRARDVWGDQDGPAARPAAPRTPPAPPCRFDAMVNVRGTPGPPN